MVSPPFDHAPEQLMRQHRPAETAELRTVNFVLDASAVVRIIEEAEPSVSFQEAALNTDLALALELILTEEANAIWRTQQMCPLPTGGLYP